ncbi:MAG: methyltransferase domain-containing protein [Acidobacteriota bacterium]|nr:methyltransferase domain-containing protein [Acidobacteriota bacterium]
MVTTATETLESVRNYYGSVLQGTKDLKSGACCSSESLPAHLQSIVADIDDEILDKFYGCGSPIPPALEGCTVLDLGCGTGRDVYMVSKLVGESGKVIGVDMTEAQLEVARRHQTSQALRFGFSRSNVDFRTGYIEDLAALGIADNSVDVVISNCVLNLSPDKRRVFSEIFRVLKPGGELYFSDVFAGRRVPQSLSGDPILRGECLGGAMYTEDFRRLLRDLGVLDFRVFSSRRSAINNPEIEAKTGNIEFYSRTIRAFKLDLEDICEDYGQVAYYLGGIPESPFRFALDDHHLFFQGKPMLVCGNTAAMVSQTRFGRYFKIAGDTSVHHGPFPCGAPAPAADEAKGCTSGCC